MPYLSMGGPPYSHFRGGPLVGLAACSHLLPLWTPHAVRLCMPFTQLCLLNYEVKEEQVGKREYGKALGPQGDKI
jgi:light-regulated signal transduction histidine kinase (bacteriophytochrome)